MAIAAILAEYPRDVILRVTDPRTGIPRKMKFMPNPAELAEECDAAVRAIEAERKLVQLGWRWGGDRWVRAS